MAQNKRIILYDLKALPLGSTGAQIADIAERYNMVFYHSRQGGVEPKVVSIDDSSNLENCGVEVIDVFFNEEVFLKMINK